MSDSGSNLEKYDAFLSGQMTEKEAQLFMVMLETNEIVAKDFEVHKSMLATIAREGRRELKAELKAIHQEKPRSLMVSSKGGLRSRLPWLAAASILLLVLGTWFFMKPMNHQQLAASYYQPYELSGNIRGNNAENLAKINTIYMDKKYSAAIPQMQEYLNNQPSDHAVRLALAISLHEQENTTAALAELNTIRSSNDEFFMDHVNWYSALFSLENGAVQTAITNLEILANDATADHHVSAKELLAKIKQ